MELLRFLSLFPISQFLRISFSFVFHHILLILRFSSLQFALLGRDLTDCINCLGRRWGRVAVRGKGGHVIQHIIQEIRLPSTMSDKREQRNESDLTRDENRV